MFADFVMFALTFLDCEDTTFFDMLFEICLTNADTLETVFNIILEILFVIDLEALTTTLNVLVIGPVVMPKKAF